MLEQHHGFVDVVVVVSAGIAALSFSHFITILAATISVVLGCIRIYDRIKYGRPPR